MISKYNNEHLKIDSTDLESEDFLWFETALPLFFITAILIHLFFFGNPKIQKWFAISFGTLTVVYLFFVFMLIRFG